MRIRVRFKVSIITIMTAIIILVSGSISGLFWLASTNFSAEIAEEAFESKTEHAVSSVQSLFNLTTTNASIGSTRFGIETSPHTFLVSPHLPAQIETLKQNPAFYSLYYGFEDETFFQVIAARDNADIKKRHNAPEETAWIVRSINRPPARLQRWAFLDKDRNLLDSREDPHTDYFPTHRPWYQSASKQDEVLLSNPYWFNSLKKPGMTASKALAGTNGVFGVDVTLDKLAQELKKIQLSENGLLVLFDQDKQILAGSPAPTSVPNALRSLDEIKEAGFQLLHEKIETIELGKLSYITHEDQKYFIQKNEIPFNGATLYLATLAPESDFSSLFDDFQNSILIVTLIGLVLFIPSSFLFGNRLAAKVTELTKTARQVRDMVFVDPPIRESHITEFDELINSFTHMSHSLKDKTKALQSEQQKLSRLVELGISMSSETDGDRLMEMVLLGAKELTHADGCSLYTVDDSDLIDFKIFRNDSLGIAFGGTTGKPADLPSIPLYDKDGNQNLKNVVSYAIHNETSVNIDDVHNADKFDFSGPKKFDEQHGYHTRSILTVPLKPRGGKVIGALQIINSKTNYEGEFNAFGQEIQPFVEALAAQAATALYNRHLLESQENLMDSLIHLIAGAIDAKSPYTGGHCARVPKLARLLAEKASEGITGSYKDFAFTTHEEWREFEVGAWLHDCGKVVTPEYVGDKATKLETIYNRIHEVRSRFEILLRDAKIEELEAVSQGTAPDAARATFEERKIQLIDDYAFIAECNIGGEFMSKDKIERLQEIAKIEWQRNFDISLGLSHEEAPRFANEPAAPCVEKLLDDKPFHVITRQTEIHDLYSDRGFKLDVPELLYNHGEIYNLAIQRGTLTAEERFKINEHIMQSIVMLEQLPLPDHMKRVPEYAGTHHETMIGTGYPRKLSEEDLSIPARIMAIADIFEALTATDRPYKKAKTLSEAIKILSFFKKDRHIDGDLFDLFLTSGVYLEYAETFLLPEQMDEVDINQYIG